jgi:tetratricopeptide (TPR) repeat protein
MKNLILLLILISIGNQGAFAQNKKRVKKSVTATSVQQNLRSQLGSAIRLAQGGEYEPAASALFSLSRRPELSDERPQIKYVLGSMLIELKMYQTAAFQFVDVIRMKHPKYSKQAIEKLSVVADFLGDDTILNYAISRVNIADFPEVLRDMLYFRIGEIRLRNREFVGAADAFNKVSNQSSNYFQAQYSKGLAELEANNTRSAIGTFTKIIAARRKSPINDPNRVAAQVGLARSLYQQGEWEEAINAYSKVPRDTVIWHQAIFEQSWAMLRAARFRSALSNFQTLHSAYYEDFYIPESLLLRAIVYLYICKYDEMEKVLGLFEKTYGPVRSKIGDFLASNQDPQAFFAELEKVQIIRTSDRTPPLKIPFIATRYILEQGNIKRAMSYIEKLNQEKMRIESSSSFRSTPLGQYGLKILSSRLKNTKTDIGEKAKIHLLNMRAELRDLFEQASFIRYEMINGKKETLRKKISGKEFSSGEGDESRDREFYVQNGYEFYPFKGEFWLDEVGNYHFLGKQSCE